ncbi:MAG: protein kinase, partial [Planctomycetes bacterium]|nr:protein kinase [Planctomycetota bacterium]
MEHSTTEFSLVCKFCGSPNAFSAEASSAELRCRSCQRLLCPDEDLPQVPGHEIIARLGEGGCGAVYLAREVKLTRLVAIKVMHATTGAPGLLERFEREARAIARLEHAGIIRVYTTGSFGNVPYMAMQYVPGHPLSEWIEKKKISTPDCIRILEKVARAVHHAHQQGVVHRDLKPANILVTPKLEPYVADFGLAKLLDETGKLTKTGVVVGTPLYMAPEQVRSDHGSIGQATDVYSLGAILFEALFGTPPFHQATLSRLYQAILQDDPIPPPNSCVHRDLESICMKALCKAPEGRYASAEAFAEDLKRYLSGEPVSVRASTTMMRARRLWRRNRRRAVAGSVLAVVLLAVAVTVSVLVGSRRKNAARAQAEVPYQEALKMLEQYEANPEGVGEDLLTTAEEALGNALAFDADFAAAYRERARCLSWQGRWGRAEEDFARSLQLDPEAAQTYLTRARVLLGRYLVELGPPKLVASPASVEIELPAPNPEARRLADATLRDLQFASEKFAKGSTPSSWEPALAKGVVALFEDRHGDAVSLLREAARGAPGVAEIPLFLGLSEFAQGHLDDAASAFEKALQFRP